MPTTEPMTPADLGRAWRELPGWRWMRGMTATTRDECPRVVYDPDERDPSYRLPAGVRVNDPRARPDCGALRHDACPDTADPATVGCLHALTEEIVGGPVDLLWNGARLGNEHVARRFYRLADGRRGVSTAYGPTRAHALYALVREVSRG